MVASHPTAQSSSSGISSTFFMILALSVALKVLLFPFYHSTDFEVHRNWLAITHSLPLNQWYHDETSEWTLDYPPFFAYFEWILSQLAPFFDEEMLKVSNLNYDSFKTVCFQRSSVLVTEGVLYVATFRYLSSSRAFAGRCNYDDLVVFFLVVLNAGLIIVDNIHFQYNGMMLGLIILCGDFANRNCNRCLAVTFSILVLMKHLFAPLAPVVGIYLIKTHCFDYSQSNRSMIWRFCPTKFLELCIIAMVSLSVAFLPFLVIVAPASQPAQSIAHSINSLEFLTYETENGKGAQVQLLLPYVATKYILDWEYATGQIKQIASRLFPFGRGLVHAYWAPNIWALYIMLDKALKFLAGKFAVRSLSSQSLLLSVISFCICPSFDAMVSESSVKLNSSTSGLVGEFLMSCVPSVSPRFTMILVVVMLIPAMLKICYERVSTARFKPALPCGLFFKTVSYAAMTFFIFGYHVHEKAILVTLLPLTMLLTPSITKESGLGFKSCRERELWHAVYMQVASGGIAALLPLLMNVEELALKGMLCFIFLIVMHVLVAPASGTFFSTLNIITIILLFSLYTYNELLHPYFFWNTKEENVDMPFLPLLLYSFVCAAILLHAYMLMHCSKLVMLALCLMVLASFRIAIYYYNRGIWWEAKQGEFMAN